MKEVEERSNFHRCTRVSEEEARIEARINEYQCTLNHDIKDWHGRELFNDD